MSSNYIYTLAQRDASIERKIRDAMQAPLPDSLLILDLKKQRLAYRERIREAIRQKRHRIRQHHQRGWTAHYITAPNPLFANQSTEGPLVCR